MLRKALFAALLAATPALAEGDGPGPNLVIEVAGVANGEIVIDLNPDIAPLHVAQIVALAQSGAYDNVLFHRVIDGFMAQTGDVQYGKKGGDNSMVSMGGSDLPDIPAEFSDVPFERGIVGMARAADPACSGVPDCVESDEYLNSANSQFFIMFEPWEPLNGQYTVVGKVISGMEIVDQIKRGEGQNGEVTDPDVMAKVTVQE